MTKYGVWGKRPRSFHENSPKRVQISRLELHNLRPASNKTDSLHSRYYLHLDSSTTINSPEPYLAASLVNRWHDKFTPLTLLPLHRPPREAGISPSPSLSETMNIHCTYTASPHSAVVGLNETLNKPTPPSGRPDADQSERHGTVRQLERPKAPTHSVATYRM